MKISKTAEHQRKQYFVLARISPRKTDKQGVITRKHLYVLDIFGYILDMTLLIKNNFDKLSI